jgi:urea transport system permease protein
MAIACVTALAIALKASPMGRRIRAVVQTGISL